MNTRIEVQPSILSCLPVCLDQYFSVWHEIWQSVAEKDSQSSNAFPFGWNDMPIPREQIAVLVLYLMHLNNWTKEAEKENQNYTSPYKETNITHASCLQLTLIILIVSLGSEGTLVCLHVSGRLIPRGICGLPTTTTKHHRGPDAG